MTLRPFLRLAFLAVLVPALLAFVEPLPLLLHKMETKMAGWGRLVIDGDRLVLDPASGVRTRQSFQLTLTRPDGIRFDVADTGSEATPGLPPHVKQAMSVILLSGDKAALYARLRQWGVVSEPLGLSRQDDTICVIMGAYENQPTRPQFWVDKFEYFPMRVVTAVSLGPRAVATESRFSGWNNPVGKGVFPAALDFYRDDVLIESWTISAVDTNAGSR